MNAYYHGESATNRPVTQVLYAWDKTLPRPPDPEFPAPWRTVTLTVDERQIVAECQVSLGTLPMANLEKWFRSRVVEKYGDLEDRLTANSRGAVGVLVFGGTVSIRRFVVTPLPADPIP